MRQIRRSGLATLMVTGGALALSAGAAHAGAGAQGAAVDSPGAISGNTIQLPVHAPVNVCGNTVNVVGLLNPAFENGCANSDGSDGRGSGRDGGGSHKDLPGTPHGEGQGGGSRGGGSHAGSGSDGSGSHGGGATAEGHAQGSGGVLSGNGIQLPIHLPVNVSGNSVNVVGIGNPAFGNTSVNGPGRPEAPNPHTPVRSLPVPSTDGEEPAPAPAPGPQGSPAVLASTGADLVGYAVPAGAALLLGGALLYRRARRVGTEA
ncbi:chaplin [Streptomyces sp. ISL-36]|uniref:chaplin n=1 Tax=Streptomyces sp. ISL-36 TaxID=2819182 RepID=UPI001BEA4A93|nr:chaplin [Streptomyces sp. ISL-36]MBT2438726.1 chaplin [Streptomyces sp. ISL-36]